MRVGSHGGGVLVYRTRCDPSRVLLFQRADVDAARPLPRVTVSLDVALDVASGSIIGLDQIHHDGRTSRAKCGGSWKSTSISGRILTLPGS